MRDSNETIVLGDFNFECDMSNPGYKQCVNTCDSHDISNCDDLCISSDRVTYFNCNLGHASFIDHFFVSSSLRPLIYDLSIYLYVTLGPTLVIIGQ